MSHHNTILSQMLKIVSRHEFEGLNKTRVSKRRSDAFPRWTQFVSMLTCQLSGLSSLRDIESTMTSQAQHRYHLSCGNVRRASLGRANESLDYRFYNELFGRLYQGCVHRSPKHDFGLKEKLFSLDASPKGSVVVFDNGYAAYD